jgi:predicted AlkP superfamily pyrophosphatase or phosphodiesterase
LSLLLGVACSHGRAADRVVIVSVDGLMPATYTEPDARGLKVPTLRGLKAEGVWSAGVRSVWPTVTYPAHTTIATGVEPAVHGIVDNLAWDPLLKNKEGWRWYAEDVKVPALWDVARQAGLSTAMVNWPVTVGARATALLPEYWRAGTPEDVKLARALSTPGLIEAISAAHPTFLQGFTPPNVTDAATADAVVYLLNTQRPALVLAHIWQTDDAQHQFGPWSPQAIAAIERADLQLGRMLDAAKRAGAWERTLFVVVSDHGFAPVARQLRPGVLLRDWGLLDLDEENHPVRWRAAVGTAGGLAHLRLADPKDEETRGVLVRRFTELAAQPESGVGRVFSAQEIQAAGGDPDAVLAIEAAPGWSFAGGYSGEARVPAQVRGNHGFTPDRPDMRASLLIAGGGVRPGALGQGELVDVAPTVAAWLGIPLPHARGRVLTTP